jgi:hypothetical protein
MDIIPAARAARYEQLEPGELFVFMEGAHSTFALKTRQQGNGAERTFICTNGGPSPQDLNAKPYVH